MWQPDRTLLQPVGCALCCIERPLGRYSSPYRPRDPPGPSKLSELLLSAQLWLFSAQISVGWLAIQTLAGLKSGKIRKTPLTEESHGKSMV